MISIHNTSSRVFNYKPRYYILFFNTILRNSNVPKNPIGPKIILFILSFNIWFMLFVILHFIQVYKIISNMLKIKLRMNFNGIVFFNITPHLLIVTSCIKFHARLSNIYIIYFY